MSNSRNSQAIQEHREAINNHAEVLNQHENRLNQHSSKIDQALHHIGTIATALTQLAQTGKEIQASLKGNN